MADEIIPKRDFDLLITTTLKAYQQSLVRTIFSAKPIFYYTMGPEKYLWNVATRFDWRAIDWFVHPLRSLKRKWRRYAAEPRRRLHDAWQVLRHGSYLDRE